jgi:shikimate dehydrogenase
MTQPTFGLIGKKLSHSFSQKYFTQKFQELNLAATYHNFELETIAFFPALLEQERHLVGLNVTIPYKTEIIPYLSSLDPLAEYVGAVNTVAIVGGHRIGYNTDVLGFRDALADFYEGKPGGKALILGTGGASKAVRYALDHFFAFDEIHTASRTEPGGDHISYFQLQETGLAEYRLIVNASPVGMYPSVEEKPNLPYDTLSKDTWLFDLVYNPKETLFMQEAIRRGLPATNGLDMLIRQAEAAWDIWSRSRVQS